MKQASRFSVQPGWQLMMQDLNLPVADVLRFAGLPQDLFSRRDAQLTVDEYFRFWHGLEQVAGEQEMALQLAKVLSVECFDPPIFASLCSPDLNIALERLQKFKPLIGPMLLDIAREEQGTRITIRCYQSEEPIPRVLATCELVFFTQLARLACRHHVVPLAVVCSTPLVQPELYQDYFGVAAEQGESNQILFSTEDACRPFLTANAGMWSFFESELSQRLADLEQDSSTAQRVKSSLLELLPAGQGSIEEVARRLAMSKRTLQRRLSAESSNYQAVLNSTRQELAQHYLLQSGIGAGEIAFLLGFQDTTSFYRAFNSWTGQTPEQYRQLRH